MKEKVSRISMQRKLPQPIGRNKDKGYADEYFGLFAARKWSLWCNRKPKEKSGQLWIACFLYFIGSVCTLPIKKTGAFPSKCTGLARKKYDGTIVMSLCNKLSQVCYAYIINCAKIQKRCLSNKKTLLCCFL